MDTLIAVTEETGNAKLVGKHKRPNRFGQKNMLTTKTDPDSCPDSCTLKKNGCYADHGPLSWHWYKMKQGINARGRKIATDWKTAIRKIKNQKPGSVWRFGEAGDLPGKGEKINLTYLRSLITANKGLRGFLYTHKYIDPTNHAKIKEANRSGLTINLSANNLKEADRLIDLNIGPVTVLLPSTEKRSRLKTPKGRSVIGCLHQTKGLNCLTCLLCVIPNRRSVVGFYAHGIKKRIVNDLIRLGV